MQFSPPPPENPAPASALRRHAGRLQSRLESLRPDIRRWGLLRTLYMRLMNRLHRVLVLCHAFRRDLTMSADSGPLPPGFSARIAGAPDLQKACADTELDLDQLEVTAALARGDICIAAFHGERMVAYTWRAFGATPHSSDLWVEFDPPHRYGYKALTLPAYRGKHLQSTLATLIDRWCLQSGFTHGISFVETHNFASITSSMHLPGLSKIGYIGYFRLFGRVYPFRSAGAARYGFGFVPGAHRDLADGGPGEKE